MSKQQAQPGLVELMKYIDSKSLPKGICTRNFDMPVDHLLAKFLSTVKPFHPSESPLCSFLTSAPSASRGTLLTETKSSHASFGRLSPTRLASST